jgi:hypothetical protein
MSARSCLLCGRSLSRWTGSGDDFCSREHRNQYRLRKSMDRLQEANKVASVMRRRESPRPLQAARLIDGGQRKPRPFDTVAVPPPQPPRIPRVEPASPPRMAPTGGMAAIPLGLAGAAVRPVCPAPPMVGLSAPKTIALRVAGAVRPAFDGILRMRPPRGADAAEGRALRVCLAVGFRIPEWKLRPMILPGPAAVRLNWPGLQALAARPFGEASTVTMEMALTMPGMCLPAAPPAVFGGGLRWPGSLRLPLSLAGAAGGHRTALVPFTASDESQERPYEYRN